MAHSTLPEDNLKLAHMRANYWNKALGTRIEYEELYSLCCLAMVKCYKTYDPAKAAWSTYACKSMDNEVCMALRKMRNTPVVVFSLDCPTVFEGDELTESAIGDEDSALELADVEIRQVLQSLPSLQRRVIYLVDFRGLRQDEAALLLGHSQSYVSRLRKSALNTLRKALA